jgi:hypothetical protein
MRITDGERASLVFDMKITPFSVVYAQMHNTVAAASEQCHALCRGSGCSICTTRVRVEFNSG